LANVGGSVRTNIFRQRERLVHGRRRIPLLVAAHEGQRLLYICVRFIHLFFYPRFYPEAKTKNH
jgi:hypothetical protein